MHLLKFLATLNHNYHEQTFITSNGEAVDRYCHLLSRAWVVIIAKENRKSTDSE